MGMQAMLEQVAIESGQCGYAIVSTLSAAAAEAVRQELAAATLTRRRKAPRRAANDLLPFEPDEAEEFAYAAEPADPHR